MDNTAYLKKYGIVTVNTKLVNIHGSLTDDFEIAEHQRLVVANGTMPQKGLGQGQDVRVDDRTPAF